VVFAELHYQSSKDFVIANFQFLLNIKYGFARTTAIDDLYEGLPVNVVQKWSDILALDACVWLIGLAGRGREFDDA
jgi:hypothetical protein